jgi:hypothetical protein
MTLEEGYMTPHLFARKLAKEAYTPEQLLEEKMIHAVCWCLHCNFFFALLSM